jgi:acetolactate synthase-1/2/3 large subunit
MQEPGLLLTGAQALATILRSAGVATVFAYSGTSELALCDSVAESGMALVNSYGDKECVFLAAGANLLQPGQAVAILHGARGLTNATGAIADVRRNEVDAVCVVGLPSTRSARFLPPHGEIGLLESIGNFTKWWYELKRPGDPVAGWPEHAGRFVGAIHEAIARSQSRPYGPSLIGLPQDLAETAWVPQRDVASSRPPAPPGVVAGGLVERARQAAEIVARSKRPIVLIDDYYLRYAAARPELARFTSLAGAPVMQVRYRRGPMLFERLSRQDVPSFLGWWMPESPWCQRLMADADLMVVLEDRNLYRRVVGDLPRCRKLALTSCADLTLKNEYLSAGDTLVEGDVVETLRMINARLAEMTPPRHGDAQPTSSRDEQPHGPGSDQPAGSWSRVAIVRAIGQALAATASPILVDDSQMFGGMICEAYDSLPSPLRVFGDHGGFVGSGIGYGTGLAIGNPDARVLCLLGDHGFMNGVQGLAVAGEHRPNITYVVCNNGGSVSLHQQALGLNLSRMTEGESSYLGKPGRARYAEIAASLGVPSQVVEVDPGRGGSVKDALVRFERVLTQSLARPGCSLIELRLPSSGAFWAGIWRTHGLDETPGATSSP